MTQSIELSERPTLQRGVTWQRPMSWMFPEALTPRQAQLLYPIPATARDGAYPHTHTSLPFPPPSHPLPGEAGGQGADMTSTGQGQLSALWLPYSRPRPSFTGDRTEAQRGSASRPRTQPQDQAFPSPKPCPVPRLGTQPTLLKPALPLTSVWPQGSYLSALCQGFLTCEMKLITGPTSSVRKTRTLGG